MSVSYDEGAGCTSMTDDNIEHARELILILLFSGKLAGKRESVLTRREIIFFKSRLFFCKG